MTYDKLRELHQDEVIIKEHPLMDECALLGISNVKGLYKNGKIAIDCTLSNIDKKCTLGEELGHHYTSYGNILDLKNNRNAKQERLAREWAALKLIDYDYFLELIQMYDSLYTVAYYLEVNKETLDTFINILDKKGVLQDWKTVNTCDNVTEK